MGRKKKPEHQSFESRNKHGRFIKLTEDMMNSKAWAELGPHEKMLYLEMKRKYTKKKDGSTTEKDISFTYQEGQKLMSKKKFTQAIDKLIEVGLIDLIEQRWNTRECNIYGLSARWHKYGTEYFKEQKRPRRQMSIT